jgi:hypothetical protein
LPLAMGVAARTDERRRVRWTNAVHRREPRFGLVMLWMYKVHSLSEVASVWVGVLAGFASGSDGNRCQIERGIVASVDLFLLIDCSEVVENKHPLAASC